MCVVVAWLRVTVAFTVVEDPEGTSGLVELAVGTGLGGREGFDGEVPPTVGVYTTTPPPLQYITLPSSVKSFSTVLIPPTTGVLHAGSCTAAALSGCGYSMLKTGLLEASKEV